MATEIRYFVMGDGGVGKSSLIIQYVQCHFIEDYDPYFDDSFRKQASVLGNVYLLDILDACYEDEFSAMRDQWIRDSRVFLVCFDLTRRQTFQDVEMYFEQIARVKDIDSVADVRDDVGKAVEYCSADCLPHVILVGCKADLKDERQVSFDEAEELARANGLFGYVETSAKARTHVQSVFELGVLVAQRTKAINPDTISQTSRLKDKLHRARKSKMPWNWARRYAWNRKLKQLSLYDGPSTDTLFSSPAASKKQIKVSLPKTAVELQRERVLDSLDILESEIFGDTAAMFAVCNPRLKVARSRAKYSGGMAPGSFGENLDISHSRPDAVIVVGATKIWCHRFILALRSTYFRTVLEESAGAAKEEQRRLTDAFQLPEHIVFSCDLTTAHPEMTEELMEELIRMMYDPWVKPSSQNLSTLLSLRSLNEDLLQISGLGAVLANMVSLLASSDQSSSGGAVDDVSALKKTQAIFTDSLAIRDAMVPGLVEFEHLSDVIVEVVVTEDNELRKLKKGDVQQFRLHAAFVSARSQWFGARLAETTSAAAGGAPAVARIDSETLPAEVFECLVEYLYCGRPPESMDPNLCLDVLSAAHMLQLPRLETICERLLEPLIDDGTVVSLWLAADFHGAKRLAERCEHYMCRFWDRISDQSGSADVPNTVQDLPADVREKCQASFSLYVEARESREREERERAEKLASVKSFLSVSAEMSEEEGRPWGD